MRRRTKRKVGSDLTTRRQALAGLSALALTPACTLSTRAARADDAAFAHGVASGDPGPTSVVIWTRLNPALNLRSLDWGIGEDPDLTNIVASGRVGVGPERDFTAKVLVESLQPGRRYYYRFRSEAGDSPVGRTRTLPVGSIDSLKLAVVSCSNYPFGHFNGYDAIAKDDQIDCVLHLGDYIYEYAADDWGGDVGASIGRVHAPLNETVSLADYRTRHAQYKSDSGSLRMHAAHPLIAIWDDHESANNPWMGGAQNHQPETEGDWPTRRAASLRAYYEWMPIREPGIGTNPAAYWRHYSFGDIASLVTLETRHTGRSRQIDYGEHLPSMTGESAARRFKEEVLGDPSRTMLSPDGSSFFSASLRDAVRQGHAWKLIGNQIPIGKVNVPPSMAEVIRAGREYADSDEAEIAQLEQQGRFDLPLYLDTWDGYAAARERLYQNAIEAGVEDLLVLTGDSHAFWLNELYTANRSMVGYEIGTAGISSPGDFERFGSEAAIALDELMAEHNPEVLWTNNRMRGYVTVALSRDAADVRYMGVTNVATEKYSLREIKRANVRRSGSTLELA